jgi:hypothetical protein
MHIRSMSVLEFASRSRSNRCATFVRVSLAAAIACAPTSVALAQGAQAPRTIQQRQPTPGRLIVPITGIVEATTPSAPPPTAPPSSAEPSSVPPSVTPEGAAVSPQTVTGSFSIQRFARTTENAVAAVGTLSLSFTDSPSSVGRTVITQLAVPIATSGTTVPGDGSNQTSPAVATPPAAAPALAATCETLSLKVGPIDLELLGVPVQLDQMNVDLTGSPGSGAPLGKLLCEATSLIAAAAPPAEIARALNSVLDMIG